MIPDSVLIAAAAVSFGTSVAAWLNTRIAGRCIKGADKNLEGLDDLEEYPGKYAIRQTRQDVAGVLGSLSVTNLLLGGILAALIFGNWNG